MAKLLYFFFLFVFLFRSLNILQYRILKKIGSFTKLVSSCTKLAKSDKHSSLPKLLQTTCTFLLHLSLRLPGNFKTRLQSFSGVSRAFQAALLEDVSRLTQSYGNFWNQKHHQFLQKAKLLFLSCMIQASNEDFDTCCLADSRQFHIQSQVGDGCSALSIFYCFTTSNFNSLVNLPG